MVRLSSRTTIIFRVILPVLLLMLLGCAIMVFGLQLLLGQTAHPPSLCLGLSILWVGLFCFSYFVWFQLKDVVLSGDVLEVSHFGRRWIVPLSQVMTLRVGQLSNPPIVTLSLAGLGVTEGKIVFIAPLTFDYAGFSSAVDMLRDRLSQSRSEQTEV